MRGGPPRRTPTFVRIVIDVVPGLGSGFSLVAHIGARFLTRSRVFTDEEAAELEQADLPARGVTATPPDVRR